MSAGVMARSRFAGIVVALCLAGVPARAEEASGVVVARSFIPSADNVHGETQVRRDDDGACCVRTILHSSSFRRGIKEILAKEAALWPEHRAGHEDSLRYREALEKAKEEIVGAPRPEDQLGSPYTLLMDFVFRPGGSFVELSRGEVVRGEEGFVIASNAPLLRIEVSDAYISRAMLVMTATALGPERHDAAGVLASAGWLDLSETPDPSEPAPVR